MRILHQVQEGVERPKASVSFEIGEKRPRGRWGRSRRFSGVVEEIDEARSRVKVAVSIFGRATPVETGIRSGREGLIVLTSPRQVRGRGRSAVGGDG